MMHDLFSEWLQVLSDILKTGIALQPCYCHTSILVLYMLFACVTWHLSWKKKPVFGLLCSSLSFFTDLPLVSDSEKFVIKRKFTHQLHSCNLVVLLV